MESGLEVGGFDDGFDTPAKETKFPSFALSSPVEWNRRFTRRMGDGMYNPRSFKARIRLSIPLWSTSVGGGTPRDRDPRSLPCDRGLSIRLRSFSRYRVETGNDRNCGLKPVPTHSVDRSGLARKQRRFILCDCPNKEKCRIGMRIFNAVQRGREFWCRKCGLKLDRNAVVEEERVVQKSTGF